MAVRDGSAYDSLQPRLLFPLSMHGSSDSGSASSLVLLSCDDLSPRDTTRKKKKKKKMTSWQLARFGVKSFILVPNSSRTSLLTFVCSELLRGRKNESRPGGTKYSDVESQEAHQEP